MSKKRTYLKAGAGASLGDAPASPARPSTPSRTVYRRTAYNAQLEPYQLQLLQKGKLVSEFGEKAVSKFGKKLGISDGVRALEQLVSEQPKHHTAYIYLADLYLKQHRYVEFCHTIKKAFECSGPLTITEGVTRQPEMDLLVRLSNQRHTGNIPPLAEEVLSHAGNIRTRGAIEKVHQGLSSYVRNITSLESKPASTETKELLYLNYTHYVKLALALDYADYGEFVASNSNVSADTLKDYCLKASSINSRDTDRRSEALYLLAEAYDKEGKLPEAYQALQQVKTPAGKEPSVDPNVWLLSAVVSAKILITRPDKDLATWGNVFADFDHALGLLNNNREANKEQIVKTHIFYGYAHRKAGSLDSALEQYGKALEIDPKNREALKRQETALEEQGDKKGAFTSRLKAAIAETGSPPRTPQAGHGSRFMSPKGGSGDPRAELIAQAAQRREALEASGEQRKRRRRAMSRIGDTIPESQQETTQRRRTAPKVAHASTSSHREDFHVDNIELERKQQEEGNRR